jgi:hypothetical protein
LSTRVDGNRVGTADRDRRLAGKRGRRHKFAASPYPESAGGRVGDQHPGLAGRERGGERGLFRRAEPGNEDALTGAADGQDSIDVGSGGADPDLTKPGMDNR